MQRSKRGLPALTNQDKSRIPKVAKITKSFQLGKQQVTLETGEIARQAGGAVMVSCDGTVVLCTAVAAKTQREGQDFFPLTVDYQESSTPVAASPVASSSAKAAPLKKKR